VWAPDAALETQTTFGSQKLVSVAATGEIARRLYALPDTRAQYETRLQELLAGAWDETKMNAEIDAWEALLTPLADPDGSKGYAAEVQKVRDYVNTRRAAITTEIVNGPPNWTDGPRSIPCMKTLGHLAGNYQATFGTLGGNPFVGSGTIAYSLNGSAVPLNPVNATAGFDANSGKDTIEMLGKQADGKYAVVFFQVDPKSWVPGTTVTFDWNQAIAIVELYDPVANTATVTGLLGNGTMTLTSAGTGAGGGATGTFDSDMLSSPFAP